MNPTKWMGFPAATSVGIRGVRRTVVGFKNSWMGLPFFFIQSRLTICKHARAAACGLPS
jgi:hypothetical protein